MSAKRPRSFRPSLECLEERTVPTVFGTNNWVDVPASQSGTAPYKMAVNIYTRNSDGSLGSHVGSGAMIAPNVVLTAGHVVWNSDTSSWRNDLLVVAGQAGDYKPYGAAQSNFVSTWTTFTNGGAAADDVGVIHLDRNLGTFTGTFGLWNRGETYFDNNGHVQILHYPGGGIGTGNQLAWSGGNVDNGSASFIQYAGSLDTAPGSSGAPVYVTENGSRYIVGVHTQGDTAAHPGLNQAVRINSTWFNRIQDWKDDHRATDKADLMSRDPWFNVRQSSLSTTSVVQGGSLSVTGKIWNGGTAKAAPFTVKFYASTDSTISTSDRFLGSATFTSGLTAFQTGNANWSGRLPSTLAAGSYRIGWVIDTGGAVSEYRENNNTGYVMQSSLTVRASTTSTASLSLATGVESDTATSQAILSLTAAPTRDTVQEADPGVRSVSTMLQSSQRGELVDQALNQRTGSAALRFSDQLGQAPRSSDLDNLFIQLGQDSAGWLALGQHSS